MCSFAFADLRHRGVLSLVFGEGVTGRPSCYDIYIVDRSASGFEMYWGSGDFGAGADIPGDIKDLRHDGKLEILLGNSLGSLGTRCIANWTQVYAWTGANYSDVSEHFKDFYRQRLHTIGRMIPALGPVPGESGYALSDKECLFAEAAAIRRFLGISPEAGIEQTVRLASSKDPAEREFAAALLVRINSPRAREYLAKLTKDPDRDVATSAKNYISWLSNRPKTTAVATFTRVCPPKHYP